MAELCSPFRSWLDITPKLITELDEDVFAWIEVEEKATRDGYVIPKTNNIITKYRNSFVFILYSLSSVPLG
jgi:hypothetical protein